MLFSPDHLHSLHHPVNGEYGFGDNIFIFLGFPVPRVVVESPAVFQ